MLARCGVPNTELAPTAVAAHCRPDAAAEALLTRAAERQLFTARGQVRVLRVARTIADLAGVGRIGAAHVAEAIALRSLDRVV